MWRYSESREAREGLPDKQRGPFSMRNMEEKSLVQLWKESTDGTMWSRLDVTKELTIIETLATRPRIPQDHLIFRIFRAFPDPSKQIKVVILGQDPYPAILQVSAEEQDPTSRSDWDETQAVSRACGFSFSSPLGCLPLSLRTVMSEILREFPQPSDRRRSGLAISSDYSGDLSYLVGQGVFLLNTFLTIAVDTVSDRGSGIPNSHKSWGTFTTQVLNFIRRICPKAVYLALGGKANDLLKASGITDAIVTDHPAARGGSRNPFAKSGIFIKTDELLEKRGLTKIDWIPMKIAIDIEYYKIPNGVETIEAEAIGAPLEDIPLPPVQDEDITQSSDDEE